MLREQGQALPEPVQVLVEAGAPETGGRRVDRCVPDGSAHVPLNEPDHAGPRVGSGLGARVIGGRAVRVGSCCSCHGVPAVAPGRQIS